MKQIKLFIVALFVSSVGYSQLSAITILPTEEIVRKRIKITVSDLPPLSAVEKIRVIDAAGLTAIFETTNDIFVVVDRATTIAAGTLPFPVVPVDGQLMMVSTRVAITALTLNSGAIPISGSISTLAAGAAKSWCYDLASNRWFTYP